MKKQSGFTLIEVLITIALVSILAAVAIPAFQSMTSSNQLTTTANELLTALKVARTEAVKRNVTVVFCEQTGLVNGLGNACTANSDWTSWGVVAEVAAADTPLLLNKTLDNGGTGAVQIQNAVRVDFGSDGVGTLSGGSTPYTGLVAEVYSSQDSSLGRRCIYITGGSSVRVERTNAGVCP